MTSRYIPELFSFEPDATPPERTDGYPHLDGRDPQKIWLSDDYGVLATDLDSWPDAYNLKLARIKLLEELERPIGEISINLPCQSRHIETPPSTTSL